MQLSEYRAHIKAKGYGVRVKRYSDFIGLFYTHKGQPLNIGRGLVTSEELALHSELQNSRMQHKGQVFCGLIRVII
jgi:hypothetical protein